MRHSHEISSFSVELHKEVPDLGSPAKQVSDALAASHPEKIWKTFGRAHLVSQVLS